MIGYRDLNDIDRSLSILDIAIGYLVSVDRDPQMLLKDFMKNQLTLKASLHSEQVSEIHLLHGRGAMLKEMIRKCQRAVKTIPHPGSYFDYDFTELHVNKR